MAYSNLMQVGSSFNRPVKVFYADSVEAVTELPTNVPAGSYCECLLADGLHVYMLRKTSDDADNGTWMEI